MVHPALTVKSLTVGAPSLTAARTGAPAIGKPRPIPAKWDLLDEGESDQGISMEIIFRPLFLSLPHQQDHVEDLRRDRQGRDRTGTLAGCVSRPAEGKTWDEIEARRYGGRTGVVSDALVSSRMDHVLNGRNRPMAQCEVCGNEYDKAPETIISGQRLRFDRFEYAIRALAPRCAHGGCVVIGHGLEASGRVYCLRGLREPAGRRTIQRPNLKRPTFRFARRGHVERPSPTAHADAARAA
jgi:hypothetical protein